MRWQEEVTLTSYEMQWTVRFFLHKSKTFEVPPHTPTGIPITSGTITSTGTNIDMDIDTGTSTNDISNCIPTPGSIAYRRRKQAIWEELMFKTDRIFTRVNNAYQSPL
jgi:hypothetical protein